MTKFEAIYEPARRSGHSTGVLGTDCVSVRAVNAGKTQYRGQCSHQFTIRIHQTLIRKCRWLSGDRVRVVFGEVEGVKAMLLVRCNDSNEGYALSGSGGKQKKGECVTCQVKLSYHDEIKEHGERFTNKIFKATVDESNSILIRYDSLVS